MSSTVAMGKWSVSVMIGLGLALPHAGATADDETITWRVQSHWPSASTSYEASLEKLRDQLYERTDGRLELELYEAGQLFGTDEIWAAVERGIVEMGTTSPFFLQDRLSLASVAAGLPFSFQEVWEAVYFYRHLGFEEMIREEASEYGVFYHPDKMLTQEIVLSEPIESMEDFEGARIATSGLSETVLSEAGAAAQYVPGEELYQALSTGVVDGGHWGAYQGADSMSLYEVAPYHVEPPLSISDDTFIFNEEAVEALPEDIHAILMDTLEEHYWERTNEYIYHEEMTKQRVLAEDGVELNPLPDDVHERLVETSEAHWDNVAAESDEAAEAVAMLREFLQDLGHLDED
ncbi:TRAP transporter substrate-binding protein DctP [Aquisalimonas sp.]|uniref:TRAP transporter substrate-binding protein DctP n=1 Tax=unclassified Aquisalimonas TaxID=2644645 RepID=UPI0025C5E2DE|nr:TRAP transporter substrate-binding protein DctP [Aquisalimonas sp.]